MAAPTLNRPASQAPANPGGQSTAPAKTPAPVIPFTRAARKKTLLLGQYGPITMTAAQQPLPVIQAGVGGFLRKLVLTVQITAAGNAATVAFAADAPFNILQSITFTSPNSDSIVSLLDGFALAMLYKYGAIGTGPIDPVADPSYSLTPGSGATGGSAQFVIAIPIEVDTRDAFAALQNMAANQQFALQLAINNLSSVYTTAPTAAPTVTITAVMHYWSAPQATNGDGNPQATAPIGDGSVSLIQTQQPAIVPSSQQKIQQLNVGNTIRFGLYILRNGSGVRTEADWPATTNFYVNNDLWYTKPKSQWRTQHAQEYGFKSAPAATPTAGALDNGVYPFTDFINDGGAGDGCVNGAQNRNLWLVTGPGTNFQVEAVNWGAAANQLQIIQNVIRPSGPQQTYAPQFN